MQNSMPQHPGRQEMAAQQQPVYQGLEPNPYVIPSVPLEAAKQPGGLNAFFNPTPTTAVPIMSGNAYPQGLVSTDNVMANAGKMNTQADMLRQIAAQDQEGQVQQIANDIADNKITNDQLIALVESHKLDKSIAVAATGMANQIQAQREAQYAQGQQGLNGF